MATTKKRAATKRPAPATRTRRPAPNGDAVRVRMYNVGFGDCFLVTIPSTAGRPTRILFDCGSIAQAPGIPIDDVLTQLWADCTDPGASHPRIDVVVATHRHRDHVSGFAKDGWDQVEVQEVWMPWTEHPTNPDARRIRETQARLALALESQVKAKLADPAMDTSQRTVMASNLELVTNALTNDRAMSTLHDGLAGSPKRRFLPDESLAGLILRTDALPDVTAYILGPSKVESVIRDMEPKTGESYLRLLDSLDDAGGVPDPFAPEWAIEPAHYAAAGQQSASISAGQAPDVWAHTLLKLAGGVFPVLSATDQDAINKLGDLELAALAALDKAVNGTSLMIVLKIGQTHLLFPGDAQWGTWTAALSNPDSKAVLKKTKFLKVGHHGSHNATPPTFVKTFIKDRDVRAMVSTRPVSNWPDIPRVPLLDDLTACGCSWVRSDKPETGDPGIFEKADKFIDILIGSNQNGDE